MEEKPDPSEGVVLSKTPLVHGPVWFQWHAWCNLVGWLSLSCKDALRLVQTRALGGALPPATGR
jgi:hypothetical protein